MLFVVGVLVWNLTRQHLVQFTYLFGKVSLFQRYVLTCWGKTEILPNLLLHLMSLAIFTGMNFLQNQLRGSDSWSQEIANEYPLLNIKTNLAYHNSIPKWYSKQ